MKEPTIAEMVRGEDFKEVLLAEIRASMARLRLNYNTLNSIGIALKSGAIDTEAAVAWILDEYEDSNGQSGGRTNGNGQGGDAEGGLDADGFA